jgi:flagellar biosynthesis GTPase FlhF
MKTKVFETGAICTAVALLLLFSLPAYAKSGGSSGAQTRVSKTPSNAISVKPVTSSGKTQSGTSQKYQLKSQSKSNKLDQSANRQQIEATKQEKAAQQADDQRKSVSDRNKAMKDSLKKTIDQMNEINRATGCGSGGMGC